MTSNSQNKYIRTVEDVSKIVHHAKLSEDTLAPVSQAIYFSDVTKEYKLLELDSELLSKLKNGTQLCFRGTKEDKAVLCSDLKTYEVKEAETSNSLLLIPQLKFPADIKPCNSAAKTVEHKEVIGIFHTYFEVKTCKPKLQKLRKILQPSSYRGSELESELIISGIKMYSMEDLLNVIQASESELKVALSDLFAFEFNGKWRLLEFGYHLRVLSYFLNLIDEQSWKCDKIPVDEVLDLLQDIVPTYILHHILSVYTEVSLEGTSAETNYVRLNENRVCRIMGEVLLRSNPQFALTEFLKPWQDSVPEGLTTNLHQLDGLVYIDSQRNQKVLRYCPEFELPEEVAERIQHLFSLKDKWTYDEIKPYIQVFATEKMNENTILTKYARASTCNGVRLYSSRHGK